MNIIHWAKKSITAASKPGSGWYLVLNEWTIMDQRAPPKSTGLADSLRHQSAGPMLKLSVWGQRTYTYFNPCLKSISAGGFAPPPTPTPAGHCPWTPLVAACPQGPGLLGASGIFAGRAQSPSTKNSRYIPVWKNFESNQCQPLLEPGGENNR